MVKSLKTWQEPGNKQGRALGNCPVSNFSEGARLTRGQPGLNENAG